MKNTRIIVILLLFSLFMTGCGHAANTDSDIGSISITSVIGWNLASAKKVLEEQGFTNITSNYDDRDNQDELIVVAQSHEVGTDLPPDTPIVLEARQQFPLFLDLHAEDNAFLNKYDMEIALDGEIIGRLSNGDDFTLLIDHVLEGEHELKVVKSGSFSPKAVRSFSIAGPTTFQSTLVHGISIAFSNPEILDEIEELIEMPDIRYIPYADAKEELRSLGFEIIEYTTYADHFEEEELFVVEQNREPGEKVRKADPIQLKCILLSEYFDRAYVGRSLEKVELAAKEAGFALECYDTHNNSINMDSISPEEKADWIIISADSSGADSAVLHIMKRR